MEKKNSENLIAYCGSYCGECIVYQRGVNMFEEILFEGLQTIILIRFLLYFHWLLGLLSHG
jgi:hypothetical protein